MRKTLKVLLLLLVITFGFMSCDVNDVVDELELFNYEETTAIRVYLKKNDANERYYVVPEVREVIEGIDVADYTLDRETQYVYIDNGLPIENYNYIGLYNIYTYNDRTYIIIEP